MTKLQFPIIVMRDDANNIRDRADQCDLAAKILELYVQQSKVGKDANCA